MQMIPLGSTGLMVSELGFGGIPLIRLDFDTAVRVVRHAFERGITFYDTANAYRDSEAKLGAALAGMRDKVVLATKTLHRDGPGAIKQLENSLRMLQTDYIDIYQLHQISQERDWEIASGPSGAMEALIKAKEHGKIRHIGVSSHSLGMAHTLAQTGIFATIQVPFNFIEDAPRHTLLATVRAQGMTMLAMKPFAGGVIDNAALAFKFLREYPEVIPIPGFDATAQVDEVAGFYAAPNVLTPEDHQSMECYRAQLGKQFCRRCEYCQPCEQGVMITNAMGYRIVAARMSAQVARELVQYPMESVKQCTACGACIARCPYELPIPDMLKANYALYEEHLKQ